MHAKLYMLLYHKVLPYSAYLLKKIGLHQKVQFHFLYSYWLKNNGAKFKFAYKPIKNRW